jgi:hypothetical protein
VTLLPGGSNTQSFEFNVVDDGGTADGGVDTSINATITVDFNLVNRLPTAGPNAEISTVEDTYHLNKMG